MAKEDPQQSDDNELEIEVDEDEEQESDYSSEEDESNESDSDSVNETVVAQPSDASDSDSDSDCLSFLVRSMVATCGVSEETVKQRWRMVPMEAKKGFEEQWRALQAKEVEFLLLKTRFSCKVLALLAQASKPNP